MHCQRVQSFDVAENYAEQVAVLSNSQSVRSYSAR